MMINCTAQCACGDRTLTGKRPEHAGQSGLDMIFIFPGPGQQFVDATDGVAIHHPREHVAQVSVRFDTVQLAGLDQRADDCPSIAATIAAGKEMILAPERHGTDSTLNWIGVELDAAIVEEAGQALPARERVTDCLGQRAAAGYARKLGFQPGVERLHDGPREGAPFSKTMSGRLSTHAGFDDVESADTAQCFGRHRRAGGLGHLVELPPRMRPTGREYDVAFAGQPLKAGIAIDMQDALKLEYADSKKFAIFYAGFCDVSAGKSRLPDALWHAPVDASCAGDSVMEPSYPVIRATRTHPDRAAW
jgi:hypothetical protein